MILFGFLKKTAPESADELNPVVPLTLDQLALHRIKGFMIYRGEDILRFPQIDKLVQEIRAAFGGDFKDFDEHILPSLRVFATYVQFLPASSKTDDDSPASTNGHHTEPLGLLIHSLQTALIALNICRNINFNFGIAPDKRARFTRACMIACAIGGLTHDIGKICDYEITTTATDSHGKSQEYSYVFVKSLPEFVAQKHGLRLKDVYFQPDNRDRTYLSTVAKLPRYEIRGAHKGRFSRHELLSNQKMLLFIRPETEEFIADSSTELYEDFTTFVFQKQLNTNYRFSNKLTSIIHAADAASAKSWIRQHYSKSLTPDDLQDTAAAVESGIEDSPEADANNTENEDAILTACEPQDPTPDFDNDDLFSKKIDEYLKKATATETSENPKEGSENAAEDAAPELSTFSMLGTVPEFKDEKLSGTVRNTLIKRIRDKINRAHWLINNEDGDPHGIIFTWGSCAAGHPADKSTTYFLRCDSSTKELLIQLIDETIEELGCDLWSFSDKTLEQNKTLRNTVRIFFACSLCTKAASATGLVLIRPVVTKSDHGLDSTGGFWALLLSDEAVILHRDSDIYREWGSYYDHAGCSFKYSEQLPWHNKDNSLSSPKENPQNDKREDSDDKGMQDESGLITADSLLARFNRYSLLKNSTASQDNSDGELTSLCPVKNTIRPRSDREIEASHALNLQEFAEETRAREYQDMIKMLTPPYVLTREDYRHYCELDDAAKAAEIENSGLLQPQNSKSLTPVLTSSEKKSL